MEPVYNPVPKKYKNFGTFGIRKWQKCLSLDFPDSTIGYFFFIGTAWGDFPGHSVSNQPQSYKITPTVTDVFHFCTICCYYQNKWTGKAISKGAKYLLVWAINNILCKGSLKYQVRLLFAIFGPPTPNPWQSAYLEKIFNSKKITSYPLPSNHMFLYHPLKKISSESVRYDFFCWKRVNYE